MKKKREVIDLEVSEKNLKWRWMALALLVVIAVSAFGYGVYSFLKGEESPESGWHIISPELSKDSCGEDFVFSYEWDEGGSRDRYRRLVSLYSDALLFANRLYETDEDIKVGKNMRAVNLRVNEVVEIDPVLYRALSKVQASGSRYLYLAPLHLDYQYTFFGSDEVSIVEDLDPYVNDETAKYYETIATFAADPAAIELELLGADRVCLRVSDEYLAFAEENGISVFVDFFRMKNAFVIDYVAETLIENGFTHGAISSYDGYVRNLDSRETRYSYNLFDHFELEIAPAARLEYAGQMSVVYLRNFPLGEQDLQYFYLTEDKIMCPYINADSGKYFMPHKGIISMSNTASCADIALKLFPIATSDGERTAALRTLADQNIFSAWFEEERTIGYNAAWLEPQELFSYEGISYTTRYCN